jgi:RNA polymerase sigma factor FliA
VLDAREPRRIERRRREGRQMMRTETEVEQLVREHQGLVRYMVERVRRRCFVGDMEHGDLISWGMLGLLQAARIWDPERACSFSTLACVTIERRILRGVRREGKPEQAAARLSLDELAFEEGVGGPSARIVDQIAGNDDVEQQLLESETRTVVRSAVAQLPSPHRWLIERHFYEGIPIAELAEELGVSRQAVYGRQRKILGQLRDLLSAASVSPPGNSTAPAPSELVGSSSSCCFSSWRV